MQYHYENVFPADQYNLGFDSMSQENFYEAPNSFQSQQCYLAPSSLCPEIVTWDSLSDWSIDSSSTFYESADVSVESPSSGNLSDQEEPLSLPMIPERSSTPVNVAKEIPRVRLSSLPESSMSSEGSQRLAGELASNVIRSVPVERNSLPASPKPKKRSREQSSRSQSLDSYEDTDAPKRKRRPSPRILRRMMEATVKQEDTHTPMFICETTMAPLMSLPQPVHYLRTGSEIAEGFSHVQHPQPQRMMHRQEEWVYEESPMGMEYQMAQ
jgi:hypothetical protein